MKSKGPPQYAHKTDENQSAIIDTLRDAGAYVQIMQPEDGFDLLVAYRGELFIMEVKRPGHIGELTQNEKDKRDGVEKMGVPYYIITEIDDALKILRWMNYIP